MTSKIARKLAVISSLFAAVAATSSADAKQPKLGDGTELAPIAPQAHYCAGQANCNGGFPEGLAVVDDRVYVAGPANFGTAGKSPSVVTVLNRDNGHLITEIPIQGEDTSQEHALSGLTVDGDGNVYALSTQLGVVRIEHHGNHYTQSTYAPKLNVLPLCMSGATPCAPTFVSIGTVSNEMIFDDDGNLYVTDSLQATIWRVPAGGGSIEPWFASPRLAGNLGGPLPFGANGIKISPDRNYLYVIESLDPNDMTQGHVYRIPVVDSPIESDMEVFATFGNMAVPDSLVFGESGKLYVSLAGSSQIAVLNHHGDEITRISHVNGSPLQLDGPATMAFDDDSKSLLVANHAIFGSPADFGVLRIYVGEKGDPYPDVDVDDDHGHGHCH